VVDLGVVPSIPLLGLIPEQGSPFLLLVALGPVAVGALAGLSLRILLVREWRAEGILDDDREPYLPRLALAGGVAVLSAASAALLALMASGSMGPGRLVEAGPAAGPVALAVGLEVLLGAAILLLGPRARRGRWVELDD
ncbi:MAG: cell division protein PerM, partial [Microbacterium sp.]